MSVPNPPPADQRWLITLVLLGLILLGVVLLLFGVDFSAD